MKNRVIAHRNYPEDRQYGEALMAHYRRGSTRIFGGMTGSVDDVMPTREVAPDILIDGFHAFELGGRRFEIIWTPGGETRSAVHRLAAPRKDRDRGQSLGPLFGNHPNLNTMRADKPRSALQFVASSKRCSR
jgi:hypothetical protein